MKLLSRIGRICYGIAIAEIGLQAIWCRDFPYMLLPVNHHLFHGIELLAYIFGTLLALAGLGIVFEKMTRQIAIALGSLLGAIFCFYYVPYELWVSPNFMHFGDWENSAKELALGGGAWVIAGTDAPGNEKPFVTKLVSAGILIFAITILSFDIDHYLYAREAAGYVPAWAAEPVFWLYFTGTALLAAALAIIFNIKRRLAATLLGAMILMWFLSLHLPRVIVSLPADRADEITSAIIALAYGGIAWVIARTAVGKSGQVDKASG